jgi:hypothetical protein
MTRTGLFRSFFVASFFALGGLAVSSCGVEQEEVTSTTTAEAGVLSQTFSGKVMSVSGAPVVGARVTINGITRLTTSTGQYAISVADSQNGYRFDIRKDGFAPVTEFKLGGATAELHLLQSGITRTIDPTKATTVRDDASGIQVQIPANVLRSSTGAPVGAVRFTVIPHTSQTMPGDFTAQNAQNDRVALISVGAVTLQAFDERGNTLGLAPNAALSVALPVPAAAGGKMPDCVLNGSCRTAMWRFNPASALWIEQPAATPQFAATTTLFNVRGAREGGLIDPADGLGTWNADIEFNSPACIVVQFDNIPDDCFNPPPGSSPELGIDITFTQALAGGGSKTKTTGVASSADFLVLYNLRPNVPVLLDFAFPPGAPANCRNNITFFSIPAALPGYPQSTPLGGVTNVDSGAPWGGTGYPTDLGGQPMDLADAQSGNHNCQSKTFVTTSL